MSGQFSTLISVWLATISHPDLASLYGQVDAIDEAGVLRVANFRRAITSRGNLFQPAYFRVKPPGQGASASALSLSIDNVDSRITYAIETLAHQPVVTIERIYAHEPDTVIHSYPGFYLLSADWNTREVTGGIGRKRSDGPLCQITNNPRDFRAGYE